MTDYTAGGIHGIVLLPDGESSNLLIAASLALHEVEPSLVRLNVTDSLPHITGVHVEADRGSALALWESVRNDLNAGYAADAFTLYLRPSAGRMWAGMDIVRTDQMQGMNDVLAAKCEARGLHNLTWSGGSYWPHLTLALWESAPNAPLRLERTPFDTFIATPALVRMGQHGTVVEVLDR